MPPTMRLTGLVAAPYSPFHADGSLNPDAIAPYADFLIDKGIRGVFISGSTGEGHSLSVDERMTIADRWVKAVRKRIPVMVHVGHNSLAEARALAVQAQNIGADAIAALAPSYYKPKTVDDLIEFLAPIAAAASALPFYFYHIPSMTNVLLPMAELLRQGRKRIPTLNGLKFTHNDMMELQECLAAGGGDFDVVFGFDEMLLAGLALGCRGAVGSTYNLAAPIYLRLIAAFEKGDLATARREQFKSVQLARTLHEFGLMRAGKAVMALLGVNCGQVRPPLNPISGKEIEALRDRMNQLEIFSPPLPSAR